jgi:hypothetical protein
VKVNVTVDVALNEVDLGEEFAGAAAEDQARFLDAAGKYFNRASRSVRLARYTDIFRHLDGHGRTMIMEMAEVLESGA